MPQHTPSLAATEPAYAKINLALHLIERLPNGYHRLDSVVGFVENGDTVQVEPAEDGALSLQIDGTFRDGLPLDGNLVIRAAQRLRDHAGSPFGARIRLSKEIPVGAGLGGGSADAAATLRALNRLWRLDYGLPTLAGLAENLGADVPACVFSTPLRMEGIGEVLTPVPHIPAMAVVLVYPHMPLWTPEVYGAVQTEDFSGQLPPLPGMGAAGEAWLRWMHHSRNDLGRAAERIQPVVREMLAALSGGDGCLFARMSGSGSACFGLYATADAASRAAERLKETHPQWWVRASRIRTGETA